MPVERVLLGGVKGSPRPRRHTADTPSVSFQAARPLEEAELGWGWRLTSCHCTHSLEQAEDEGVEAHSMTVEFWELADFVVEAMQDLGGWAWEEDGVGDHISNFWSPIQSGALCFDLVPTELCGSLDHTPRHVFALANDHVQHEGLEPVLQHRLDCGAQVLQNQVADVGAHRTVSQLCLQTHRAMVRRLTSALPTQPSGVILAISIPEFQLWALESREQGEGSLQGTAQLLTSVSIP